MIPQKPFESYKWRWLSVAPTESLLNPPIFLGVLRVLARHEGQPPSTKKIVSELTVVTKETKSRVNLARTPDRNIIRNSGQYWKGTGLLTPDKGTVNLTSLGKKVAEGRITQSEFAAIMVQQTILPNPWTYKPSEAAKWKNAGLEIRPLALILQILNTLASAANMQEGYLTVEELIRVVIPLSGAKTATPGIVDYVRKFRKNPLVVSGWPDCTPRANDDRLAREFFLFLSNFGFCRKVAGESRLKERFYLEEVFDDLALGKPDASIFSNDLAQKSVITELKNSPLPSIIERQRVLVSMLQRPGQEKFRKEIMKAYSGRCLLSGERIPEVLEAAHIIPVKNKGTDTVDNGICLRVDIHRLFDAGQIRIMPDGGLLFADSVKKSPNYKLLPNRTVLPNFLNKKNFAWRHSYL